jgi:hypothetical protein
VEAFRQGLRELGWVEGQNVSIEYGWADGKLDRLPALASDLVRAPVDVILVSGVAAIRAALQATPTVPIVSAITSDPVVYGFATSFARPGGSVTGLATQFDDLATKQLQLLKETVPRAARVAILAQHISTSLTPAVQKAAEAAVRALGLKAQVFEIRDVAELDRRGEDPGCEGAGLVRDLARRSMLAEVGTSNTHAPTPVIGLHGKTTGDSRVIAIAKEKTPPHLALFDKAGKVPWKAP